MSIFRRLTGTSLPSKEKKLKKRDAMPSDFGVSEESLEYIHPADLTTSKDPLQRSLPSMKRYSRHNPDEEFASSSSSRNRFAGYPPLPTIETTKILPEVPPEPSPQDDTPDYVEENFKMPDDIVPLRHKESDPQFPGAFETDPHPTSPAAAAASTLTVEAEAVDDSELVVADDVEVKSFVEVKKDADSPEDDREKLPAEEDMELPPTLPDKNVEPDPPVPDYVEERKRRRPRNPGGFGSFLDNIVDLQAAGHFEPVVVQQPVENPPVPVISLEPPAIRITPPSTPAPNVPDKPPHLYPQFHRAPSSSHPDTTPTRSNFPTTRHNPLPTPALETDPPPTPSKSIFGIDPSTANRIAELARRRRMEASGQIQHSKSQSVQLSNTLPAINSSSKGKSPNDADEFGHRRGQSDVSHSMPRRPGPSPIEPPPTSSRRRILKKQPSEEPYFPPTPVSIPTSPSALIPPSPALQAELDKQKETSKTLQALLDDALAQVESLQADNERLQTRQKREKERLVEAMRLQLSDNEKLAAENKSLINSVNRLKTDLHDSTQTLKAIKKEKEGWQAQLDAMQNQVISTDKRIRCLDTITKQQFEAKQNILDRQIKRRGKMSNRSPAAEVVTAVKTLNEEILQTSSILVEQMERDPLDSIAGRARAQKVLGPQLTEILEGKKHQRMAGANVLLLQVVLEVFIVHWCSSIIDAFYPTNKTFSDLLIELSQKPPISSYTTRASPTCGKYLSVVQTHRSDLSPVNFPDWVKDILADLSLVLSVGGQRVKSTYHAALSIKLTALVKSSYELRTALAEHDICGYLETIVVTPSMPFQPKWMLEAHSDSRTGSPKPPAGHADVVLGTCGIGLQQNLPPAASSTATESTVVSVLKPQVVLSRVIMPPPAFSPTQI